MEPDLTLTDAAERLGVHYMTAYRYVRTGRLEATKVRGEWRLTTAALARFLAARASVGPSRAAGTPPRARSRPRLEDRIISGDETGAWRVIEDALASGATPEEVVVDLLMPALAAVGQWWAEGVFSVADEHRASATAIRLVARMGPHFLRRGRRRGTVIVGAPGGERHAIPVAVVADLLRGAGFDVVELGADTPPVSFGDAVVRVGSAPRPVAVLIGVTVASALDAARESIVEVARVDPDVPILVGGAATSGLPDALALGAAGWTGLSARDAVEAVERLVSGVSP